MSSVFPKISVITPSYNQGHFLEETIQSVLAQQYPNLEFIVVDGGSTDNSAEIIRRYAPHLAHWQSQPDRGQSDALNQGFRRATGDFVTWLNSDDLLLPGTLMAVARAAQRHPDTQWFAGNLLWIDPEGRIELCRKGEGWSDWLMNRGVLNLYGPTSFFRKKLLDVFGYLREDFHYTMDTELWWRLAFNKIRFRRLEQYCWAYRLHESSKMSGHHFQSSQLADENHPSWLQKRREEAEMERLYGCSAAHTPAAQLLLAAKRLTSPRYLSGRLDDLRYRGLPVSQFPAGK
jgi:glycosyltransferase involved in cell wall biosynthesis